jgi:hypothetical protein
MTTKGTGLCKSQPARRNNDGRGRRRLLAGIAAVGFAPVAASGEPRKPATNPEEALQETYEALMLGAGQWGTSAAQRHYMDALRADFDLCFAAHWSTEGDAVKLAAKATGVLAVLIAKGMGATSPELTKEHVFMASAIVKASKACRSSKSGLRDEPRGRFCQSAAFGKVEDALKALLKEYPPT